MEMRETAGVDDVERCVEHLFRLGRKADDEVGAKDDVGPRACAARGRRSMALCREWRRFMRFKIRSSPDCSDR